MTIIFSEVFEKKKEEALELTCHAFRNGNHTNSIFQVEASEFSKIPGSPFAYWSSAQMRGAFSRYASFNAEGRTACVTNPAGDDTRYFRSWWEVSNSRDPRIVWMPLSKGGRYSKYYYSFDLVVCWYSKRSTYLGFVGTEHRPLEKPASLNFFFRPGITWPRRTTSGLSMRALPSGSIFADKGPAAFVEDDNVESLLSILAIVNSKPFFSFVSLQLAAADAAARSYEVGVIQRTPVPSLSAYDQITLSALARRAWSLNRTLDLSNETSHAFTLPPMILKRVHNSFNNPLAIKRELDVIQKEIDGIISRLYEINNDDNTVVKAWGIDETSRNSTADYILQDEGDAELEEDEVDNAILDQSTALLSWATGVAFGRFDIRLATGERMVPSEPEPFDPLPTKSPGMLPDDDVPFHSNFGILVEDTGHAYDLPHLLDCVLDRVSMEVGVDTRSWLRREFFPMHLKQYSKSRRKAPIYWPLSTASGAYTLWLYYPALTDQTLFVAANDFVGIKLERQVEPALRTLRQKTGRSREEERELEELQTLHDELRDLRAELLRLALEWKPNHDDGVQITAAPLWRLFRHRPWQTLLRETWEKLEEGAYDWSHLAIVYWPDRVREKCRTDKSLAIAHDLEHLYEPPPEAPAKAKGGRGRKKKD